MFLLRPTLNDERHRKLKQMLYRIVSILTRLIARSDVVAEPAAQYNAGVEYKYEYREAEYEYDESRKPEPGRAP